MNVERARHTWRTVAAPAAAPAVQLAYGCRREGREPARLKSASGMRYFPWFDTLSVKIWYGDALAARDGELVNRVR